MDVKRRSLLERVNAIFRFIDVHIHWADQTQISKSEFQKIGFSPRDMDQWIELITTIQSSPRITLVQKGKRKYIDQHDNKFTLYMKRIFLNPSKDYEERKSALLLYFHALIALEKMKADYVDIEGIIKESWELDKPTIVRMTDKALTDLNEF